MKTTSIEQLQRSAKELHHAGKFREASENQILLLNLLKDAPAEQAKAMTFMATICDSLGDYKAALGFLEIAYQRGIDDVLMLENLGACHARLGNLKKALFFIKKAQDKGHQSLNMLAGLAEVCGRLGLRNEAAAAGTDVLAIKSAQTMHVKTRIPAGPRRRFDKSTPERNIIAYSLWGDSPEYMRGAVLNARRAKLLYEGWTARFYINDTVPADIREALADAGAQLVFRETSAAHFIGTFWRFHAACDPDVDFFLIRDCDSLLNIRDRIAVEEWLTSERCFHVMRDWCSHTELILAGMWGGIGNVLSGISAPEIARFIHSNKLVYGVDQLFLEKNVWPQIRDCALVHDSWFSMPGSRNFPADARVFDEPHLGYKTTFMSDAGDSCL